MLHHSMRFCTAHSTVTFRIIRKIAGDLEIIKKR